MGSLFHRSRRQRSERRAERERLRQASSEQGLPEVVWGTKGFEFWTLLALLLRGASPRRILELGSGRSTIAFGEYAKASGAELVSLETSAEWFRKGQLELHFLGLPAGGIVHLELDDQAQWYRLEEFRARVKGPFDCVLIDGPNDGRGDSQGMRDAPVALAELRRACRGADLVLVDDVHRRHVFDSVEAMVTDLDSYETRYFDYQVRKSFANSLAISAKRSSPAQKALEQAQGFLGLELDAERRVEDCPEP